MEFIFMLVGAVVVPAAFFIIVIRKFLRTFRGAPQKANRHADVAGRDGMQIEKSPLAKLGLGTLEGYSATVASAGSRRAAPMSLDEHILRPTLGVRAISIVATGAFIYLLMAGDQSVLPVGDGIKWALLATVAYAIAFIQSYELRYNRDRLVATGYAFNQREKNWRDLTRIQDNGHYLFVLTFADGSKLEVQKHLVGMADFLTYAQSRIAANNETGTGHTHKPSGSVFGTPKTFS